MPHFDAPVFEGDVGVPLEKAALERAVQSLSSTSNGCCTRVLCIY
jgi:hypothetical protein